jgi:hypothetical protein
LPAIPLRRRFAYEDWSTARLPIVSPLQAQPVGNIKIKISIQVNIKIEGDKTGMAYYKYVDSRLEKK